MERENIEKHKTRLKDLDNDIFNSPEEQSDVEAKKVYCPSCSSQITSKDINIHNLIGKCNSCDSIFPVKADFNNPQIQQTKTKISRPAGIDLFAFQDRLDVAISNVATPLDYMILVLLPIIFITVMAFIKAKLSILAPGKSIGLLILYTMFRLITRTRPNILISADKEELVIRRWPAFFASTKYYETSSIDQLYVKKTKDMHTFNLRARVNTDSGQKDVSLVNYIQTKTSARYLEQEIEAYLRIKDQQVPEEIEE